MGVHSGDVRVADEEGAAAQPVRFVRGLVRPTRPPPWLARAPAAAARERRPAQPLRAKGAHFISLHL